MAGKRFIVIEPSIKDEAGHYLQYARDVLRAAEAAGYTPVLACHKDFREHEVGGIEVVPAFTHTFWHRYATANQARGAVSRAYYHVIRIRNGLILRLNATWYFSRAYVALGHVTGPLVDNKITGTILRIIALPFWIGWRIWSIGRFRAARIAIYNRFYKLPETLFRNNTARAIPVFAEDLMGLHARLKLNEDDRLLLATVSGAELEGLLRAAAASPGLSKPTWHLVFRRNLRPHPAAEFGSDLETDLVRSALDKLKSSDAPIRLHTDTDALTAEYNALAEEDRFDTLPIPHVRPSEIENRKSKVENPKLITYLGDARPEKGFQYLSRIVAASQRSLLATGKARFRIQSNFNIAAGEPDCAVCRKELEKFPHEHVELITSAQSEREYKRLLDESAIVLVPYDVNNYSERSSGIFAEAVGAGIPVIVPSGTWMSRQLLAWSYPALARLFETALRPERASVQCFPIGTAAPIDNPLETRWIVPGGEPRFAVAITCPTGARQVMLKLVLTNPFARVKITCRDASGVPIGTTITVLERDLSQPSVEAYSLQVLGPGTERLQIEVLNASLADARPEVAFNAPGQELKFTPPGEIYFDWTEMPRLLERMVDNQECYRASMAAYSAEFREFHSPEGFMKHLSVRQEALVG